MKIHLVTDSATDLPLDFIEAHQIRVAPLQIQFKDRIYEDRVDLSVEAFYEQMAELKDFPLTSLPSPQKFVDLFNEIPENDAILCITISAATSGTYQSAMVAKGMVKHRVEVIDSLHISMGTGLQIMEAARLIQAGLSLEEIVSRLMAQRHQYHTFIAINDLDNVIKGGRISNWKGSIAKIMNIKPTLNLFPDGSIHMVDYSRGRKKQLRNLLELIEKTGKDLSQGTFVILHAMAPAEEVAQLKEAIEARFRPKEMIIDLLGPTMGAHGGFGAIGIAF